jgi:hypothetical protein
MPNIPSISSVETVDRLLSALAEQLQAAGTSYDVLVVGGSALLALGLVARPTQDVDIVALKSAEGLAPAEPLPAALAHARIVSRVTLAFPPPGSTAVRPHSSISVCPTGSRSAR